MARDGDSDYDGTKNEIVFDPGRSRSDDDRLHHAPFLFRRLHRRLGTSRVDPIEGVDENWQIASYSILRYNQNGFFKGCGDVVVPLDVPNTAFADGTDSNSDYGTDEQVSDTATVQVIRQLKIEIRNEPVIKGKKMDVLLNNTGEDVLTITQIEITWP